jgi:hypothetical protein
MKTTFNNSRLSTKESKAENKAAALKHLKSRAKDFIFYMNEGEGEDSVQDPEKWLKKAKKLGVGPFYQYGLSFDYVAPGTFVDNKKGYWRYQLSFGGPSEEIRFFGDHNFGKAYKIEFVYLEWGTGCGIDVTNEDWAKWLWDLFSEFGSLEAEYDKALTEA